MDKRSLLSNLPKVDDVINDNQILSTLDDYPRATVVDAIREQINSLRNEILSLDANEIKDYNMNYDRLIKKIIKKVISKNQMKLRKVINATGVVLHTNLGRALISEEMIDSLIDVACNYSTLEFNLENGKRGSRYSHVEEIICKLTGAEAALVVNNNAAAVMLVLSTLAKNKEVIVSRGQLVEIGGSFRIPEVMKQSGAKLVEVGATNKTHLHDYESNINEETSIVLKVHTSNYKIMGFSEEVPIEELVGLGKKYNIPIVEDIGSGTLIDFSKHGLKYEPTVQESIKKGADIVTFSGDKLLGGPQAGIIIGKKELIEKMKKNQLTRAIRVDKLTLVVLEATLRQYLDEEKALNTIPTLKMLTMKIDEINRKADLLLNELNNCNLDMNFEKLEGLSQIGGGSMPLEFLPTYLIAIKDDKLSANDLEVILRMNKIPVICRINEDKVLLDLRTIKESEFDEIVQALESIKRGE